MVETIGEVSGAFPRYETQVTAADSSMIEATQDHSGMESTGETRFIL